MLAIRADANERHLADLFYVRPQPLKLDRKTVITAAAVLAVYGAAGVYLAYQKWVLAPTETIREAPMDVTTYRPIIPDEPQPKVDEPPPEPTPVEQPQTVAPRMVETIAQAPDITPIPAPAQVTPAPAGPVALAALTPTTPPATTGLRPAPLAMILNPDWIGKPTAAQANNAFPSRALRMGVSGHVELVCTVQVSGSVAGCQVASETGAYGFGAAAISLAPFFKMKPRTVDGQAVEGAKVRIPVDFNLG